MAGLDHPPHLTPVGEKQLPAKCKPGTLSYCPTMDLIALATENEELHVFRLNGQRVLGGSFEGDPYLDDPAEGEIRTLAWKNNGHSLAVACGDGSIRIISSYSGKTVHHYSARVSSEQSSQQVTCLGWGVNCTDTRSAQRVLQEGNGNFSIEDLLSPDTQPDKAAALFRADLPRELALLDVESSLPKLSTLPGTGGDDDVFSSRASLDAMFHATAKTSDSVDVLVVGFDDGTLHLRIFDCFEIGSLQIGAACRILRHASHPFSSTHALVASVPSVVGAGGNPNPSLRLITLDLRFIPKSGRYLSLLASKTTQLQNLLRYINQVQRQIELEWKNAQELPVRYMRSVNEDLQEKCHCDFITAAYHLVVTGDCFEPLKEFLVDIVGERGHKRWDKAVSSGYENVRRLTHECLLPALERCEVLLSRLIGLSKFHKLSDVLGLDTASLNCIIETLDCLHLLAHQVLICTNDELAQFSAFSRWLRHEIDVQSAEPMSQTLEDLLEKTDTIEHPQTLKYIRGALTNSVLRKYIQQLPMMGVPMRPPTAPGSADKWLPTGQDGSFYATFRTLLEQSRSQKAQVELPKLNDLTKRLGIQFDKVFGRIALTQRRGILHKTLLTLHPDCDVNSVDMIMCYETVEGEQVCSTYVVARSLESKELVYIYRVTLDSVNGITSTKTTSVAALTLPRGVIRQAQFVQDETLSLLWEDGSLYLLNLAFQPSPTCPIQYMDHHGSSFTTVPPTPTTLDVAEHLQHAFAPSGPKARPVRVDINGRKGRRAACVLYEMRYEVLDIDAEMDDEDDEDEE
ncbi:hypothetical protein ASPZODRAFT_159948 [Penicilliopsis zonata CBS 506.65]|uniref:Anaphase-promoting complex subunit 4 n=1 Tax=Penicilliopsis zonata CBS 506.65 TaxID=1073090 RepID=A0A1L9SF75_9EURO|nr:hypothetical protein ASPZODRAFT_159948 [Penicilliopsis zonata CBS 506.65]OJJ45674.1 hypothetical protein ASPZODRAFT_159948 [Penicilliopsis zonata CBS 506.65]